MTRSDPRRGLAGDPELLFLVPTALVTERELIKDPLRDRAAMRSRQQPLAFEKVEVTADGRRRHAKLVRDYGDIQAAVPRQPLQDRLQPLGLSHRNRH